jgi:ParB family transcriptional regulator, chromosome partitioning protein
MGKLDELLQTTGANIDESMGAGRRRPGVMHSATPSVPDRLAGISRSKDAAEIPTAKIDRDPDQPREEFDEESLARLAESLKARGQLQPIRVRWDEGRGVYVIVCGERRWRAARMAELSTMSCVIVDRPIEAGELLAIQLIENCLREDLRPIEQAKAYRSLMQANGWSGNQLARELSINQSNVARALALLDLPELVQAKVEQGALTPSVAYEVSKLDDPEQQREVAEKAVAEKLTRAEVVAEIRQHQSKPVQKRTEIKTPAGTVIVVSEDVEAALKAALKQYRAQQAA